MPGSLLIFGGRRWKVLSVDTRAKIVELVRSSGGRVPKFTGSGGEIADRIRREMLAVYKTSSVPVYLNASAARLLAEGRANFARFGLDGDPVLEWGADTLIFPWRGDRIMSTLAVALTTTRVDIAPDGVCLTMTGASRAEAIARLQALAASGPGDPLTLATGVQTKIVEKYDDFLSDELLDVANAARSLDVDGAWHALTGLLNQVTGQSRTAAALDA
jgi:ATP-dependent Lhr-like helicase